jgi:hypothetical protein
MSLDRGIRQGAIKEFEQWWRLPADPAKEIEADVADWTRRRRGSLATTQRARSHSITGQEPFVSAVPNFSCAPRRFPSPQYIR